MTLNLLNGITETEQYKAWKFPGGEIHFKLNERTINDIVHWNLMVRQADNLHIYARITSAENLLFLALVVDTIYKDFDIMPIVHIGYMPYQQADRDFGVGECFSLHTICNILNSLPVHEYIIFDPHSDVTPALLNNVVVEDNSEFIKWVLNSLDAESNETYKFESLVVLSPDAGAYKKIFKLCDKIGFTGSIETANKYRDTKDGGLHVRLSTNDFEGRDILIIDDICMGGRTFIELAKQLQDKNIGNMYLAVSHGIFNNGYQELGKYFKGIYTTNSFQPFDENFLKPKMYNIFQ
jgi:ribose-phosphate pyrophosphokinase